MSGSYGALASFYDTFTGNVDYGRRADFLAEKLMLFGRRDTVLDAGCGTGTLARLLLQRGFDVIGVDNSPEMLSVAREADSEMLLLCQDLTELDLYGTVQGAVCMQDTLNHLPDIAAFKRAVGRISLFMEPGAVFAFDLNSEYKHRQVLADNCFVYESDSAMCVWQNELEQRSGTVHLTVDVFSENEDGSYYRDTDAFSEILISAQTVLETLQECGLSLVEQLDGESYGPLCDTTERILYITRKL
ncbi:MAG: class I SAM-dependent methyltransferase [Oscillospiraceae bacterium]|nr:class I SAM-dependent methyltransferase [Oscillospiraceae bacterium]